MRLIAVPILIALSAIASPQSARAATDRECARQAFENSMFTVCAFDVGSARLMLFHARPSSQPYGEFSTLVTELAARGLRLRFAMNAGMYHEDRAPVGLLIEAGVNNAPLNVADADGNFFLKPNGVFYFDGQTAGVLETATYLRRGATPAYATQSGPMLVIDGQLHPALSASGTSRVRRNGVGVSADGRRVAFAISEGAVNLHTFARLFRDHLALPNALYLDGAVSRLYARQLNRNDAGPRMGPIVGVVETLEHDPTAQGTP